MFRRFIFSFCFYTNGNGRNEHFKALNINGINIADYELRVYNRWGEIVFITTEPNMGWDGNYKGRRLNTDSFVWHVKYFKTNDAKPVFKKGLITLIR